MATRAPGTLRFHPIRRHKKVSASTNNPSVNENSIDRDPSADAITPDDNTTGPVVHLTKPGNLSQTSQPNENERTMDPDTPSFDHDPQHDFADISISICDDQALNHRRAPPMSFTRRIVSMLPFRFGPSRTGLRDAHFDDDSINADEYSSMVSSKPTMDPVSSRDTVHKIHQGTEGEFRTQQL